jgi:predicted glycosyltransferase
VGLRILIYAQDTHGLGHVRRSLTLARALLDSRPDAEVVLATKSSWPASVALGLRFQFLRLPTEATKPDATPDERHAEREASRALRSGLLRSAVARLRPHLILVDNEPLGYRGEMAEALAAAGDAKLVFGMRDVLDDPARTLKSWGKLGVVEALRERFAGILVYGHHELFDTLGTYELPADVAQRAHYTGYVVEARGDLDVGAARTRLGAQERPLVVVTGGGGEEALPMSTTVLDALPLLALRRVPRALIVTGPFMSQEERETLAERARADGHEVRETADVLEAMAAAHAVVAMGGYNTLAEAMMLGRRPIVVPRVTYKREQLIRALAFERHGLVRCLPPSALSREAMAELLEAELAAPTAVDARRYLDLDGRRAARLLLELGSA